MKYNIKHSLRNEPYLFINLIFAGIILLIIAYSGIFSAEKNNYPITCIHEKVTGEPCFSCGLSHSFSLIARGRFAEADKWNLYGSQVFLFFAGQLVLRILFSILYLKFPESRRKLIITDCIGSGVLFFIAFRPFINNIISTF